MKNFSLDQYSPIGPGSGLSIRLLNSSQGCPTGQKMSHERSKGCISWKHHWHHTNTLSAPEARKHGDECSICDSQSFKMSDYHEQCEQGIQWQYTQSVPSGQPKPGTSFESHPFPVVATQSFEVFVSGWNSPHTIPFLFAFLLSCLWLHIQLSILCHSWLAGAQMLAGSSCLHTHQFTSTLLPLLTNKLTRIPSYSHDSVSTTLPLHPHSTAAQQQLPALLPYCSHTRGRHASSALGGTCVTLSLSSSATDRIYYVLHTHPLQKGRVASLLELGCGLWHAKGATSMPTR